MPAIRRLFGITIRKLGEPSPDSARREARIRRSPATLARELEAGSAGRTAFIEHGAIMAATVLNGPRAVETSVFVVRAFVRLRDLARTHADLARPTATSRKSRPPRPDGDRLRFRRRRWERRVRYGETALHSPVPPPSKSARKTMASAIQSSRLPKTS